MSDEIVVPDKNPVSFCLVVAHTYKNKNDMKLKEEIMKYTRKLFFNRHPFVLPNQDEIFLQAVKENCSYHYAHCEIYRRILDGAGFKPESLQQYEDMAKLPFIPTLFLKQHRIFSMSKKRMLIKATSSGTSGKYSKIGFDWKSLLYGFVMVLTIARYWKLMSPCPCHYVVLGYKPHKSNQKAIAKTAFGYTLFSPALSRTYALTYQKDGYELQLDEVIDALVKHSHSHFPVKMIGFPAYTYFLMQRMKEKGILVKLPAKSSIMLGGGWKQFYKEQVDKKEFYALVWEVLGIAEDRIIESYGAAEHPILYCDCKNHHFHVPVYSRVLIRDVHTLKPVKNGEIGLVNLITPMNLATPIVSIMTDDLGVLHDGGDCGCGIQTPYLEIIGRVGLKDIKTCAAGAEELL